MGLKDKIKAVADAIRSKTGKTAKLTLDQMRTEIGELGKKVTVDGVDVDKELNLKTKGYIWDDPASFNYRYYSFTSCVVFNDKLHWFFNNQHYTVSPGGGTSFIGSAPNSNNSYSPTAVVFNGMIYYMGTYASSTSDDGYTYCYRWDGKVWTKVCQMPYKFSHGHAVEYRNAIYIFGNGNTAFASDNYLYRLDGSKWTKVSGLPIDYMIDCAYVVWNDKINVFGNYESDHWKSSFAWNGSSWESLISAPYSCFGGAAFVIDGKIHLLGGSNSDSDRKRHYMLENNTWVMLKDMNGYLQFQPAVVYKDAIYAFGTYSIENYHPYLFMCEKLFGYA